MVLMRNIDFQKHSSEYIVSPVLFHRSAGQCTAIYGTNTSSAVNEDAFSASVSIRLQVKQGKDQEWLVNKDLETMTVYLFLF